MGATATGRQAGSPRATTVATKTTRRYPGTTRHGAPPASGTATDKPGPPAGGAAQPDPVPRAAFSAGWLMAQLHGQTLKDRVDAKVPLPAFEELGRADLVELALERLERLLGKELAGQHTPVPHQRPLTVEPLRKSWDAAHPERTDALRQAIEEFHRHLLTRLTVTDHRYGSAYSLGRSLSDTCWPPDEEQLRHRFHKSRLSELQTWLADLGGSLPELSAPAVSQGLDHWEAWLHFHTGLGKEAPKVIKALNSQGEHWRSLLAGDKDPTSLLTPEAYVQAGEAALHRAGRMARRIVVHFWWLFLLILVATAGVVFLSLRYAEGAAKVWATGLSLLASFGVTGTTLRTAGRRLATQAGHTLFELEEADAVGWAATWLPPTSDGPLLRRRLRKAGVAPPAHLQP